MREEGTGLEGLALLDNNMKVDEMIMKYDPTQILYLIAMARDNDH